MRCTTSVSLAAGLVVAAFQLQAQVTPGNGNGGIGDPSAAAGSPSAQTYSIRDIEHLNYYSGSVNFTIPLASVSGRGSAVHPIFIPIQRQWFVTTLTDDYGDVWYEPESSGSGYWQPTNRGLGTVGIQSIGKYPGACYQQDQWGNYWYVNGGPYVTYVIWTQPDGTQTILTDTKYNGQPQGANGCPPTNVQNRGRIFRSTDGSGVTFTSTADIVDNSQPHNP